MTKRGSRLPYNASSGKQNHLHILPNRQLRRKSPTESRGNINWQSRNRHKRHSQERVISHSYRRVTLSDTLPHSVQPAGGPNEKDIIPPSYSHMLSNPTL
eukprot:1182844-Prorocentrum_minimum.AAC.3